MPKQAFTPTWTYQFQFSELVLGYVMGSDIGHAFREIKLTKTPTLQFGSVIQAVDANTGIGAEATGAGNADTVFVWTDEAAFDFANIPNGTVFKAVVAKRDVTLDARKVVFLSGSTTTVATQAVVDALDAKGLKLTDKVLQPYVPTT